jgi:hypothetical protein
MARVISRWLGAGGDVASSDASLEHPIARIVQHEGAKENEGHEEEISE